LNKRDITAPCRKTNETSAQLKRKNPKTLQAFRNGVFRMEASVNVRNLTEVETHRMIKTND